MKNISSKSFLIPRNNYVFQFKENSENLPINANKEDKNQKPLGKIIEEFDESNAFRKYLHEQELKTKDTESEKAILESLNSTIVFEGKKAEDLNYLTKEDYKNLGIQKIEVIERSGDDQERELESGEKLKVRSTLRVTFDSGTEFYYTVDDKGCLYFFNVQNKKYRPEEVFYLDEKGKLGKDMSITSDTSSPEILDLFANSEDVVVRQNVSLNKNTSLDTLKKLINDKNKWVRYWIAKHHKTTTEMLAELAGDNDEPVRVSVAENPNTSALTLITLSEDPSSHIRSSVAFNINTPKNVMKELANDSHPDVRAGIASHVDLESKEGLSLLDDTSPKVITSLASRDDISLQLLSSWGSHPSEEVREAVVMNPQITNENILGQFFKDKSPKVRAALTYKGLTPEQLKSLAQDKSEIVSRNVADRRDITQEIMGILFKKNDRIIMNHLANNPSISEENRSMIIDYINPLDEDHTGICIALARTIQSEAILEKFWKKIQKINPSSNMYNGIEQWIAAYAPAVTHTILMHIFQNSKNPYTKMFAAEKINERQKAKEENITKK